ncbi:5-(carboxyamino)imidazole ribonucleotide synthase [Pelagibacteraceae bacterium]|nr:5-(carboxyamino)imidazole ribonucleotide synthase [Pelagibacteraceae bacterium]
MNKPTLGIIGGGQLGSLLADAARKIDIKTVILSDDPGAPAKHFATKFIFGQYDDDTTINNFINEIDLVTYEFENIPFAILKKINEKKKVLPKPEINQLIQHRETEKNFLNDNNITTTKYATVKNKKDLNENLDLLPGLLKTTTLGYDGKGQYKLNTTDDITNEIDFTKEYILEKLIHLKKEISVVITRYDQNSYEIYEPIENVHEEQILKYSTIPSDIPDYIRTKSIEWAKQVVEKLDYIGTLCVEYFIDADDNLYANEIAPRVHNSGHLTMNSYNISQFENHVRAVCGLEKIKTKKLYNAKMINLIGDDITPYRNKTFKDNEFFYDYLKIEIKNKRKMGHVTIIEK